MMSNPGGGFGPMPFLGCPGPQQQAATTCPAGCIPPLIISASPKPGSVARAYCRCLRCMTYWEVTPTGKVINRQDWPPVAGPLPE